MDIIVREVTVWFTGGRAGHTSNGTRPSPKVLQMWQKGHIRNECTFNIVNVNAKRMRTWVNVVRSGNDMELTGVILTPAMKPGS